LCEFDPWLGQIKDYKIGFGASPFSKQYKGILKDKDWLTWESG